MKDPKPLHLMINPNATWVAHRASVPVPVHWQKEVTTGLDQDLQLGVIEPVPIGNQ